jgi:hypothetical protein
MATIKVTNPVNDYKQEISELSWLWSLIFGAFFFAFKGAWKHFIIGIIAAIVTVGISWLIYPFFARQIIINSYLERGWSIDGLPQIEMPDSEFQSSSIKSSKTAPLLFLASFALWLVVSLFFGAAFATAFDLALDGGQIAAVQALAWTVLGPFIIIVFDIYPSLQTAGVLFTITGAVSLIVHSLLLWFAYGVFKDSRQNKD